MPSLFTEDTYEQAIIELFENMGYEHLYAPDYDRDYTSPLLDSVLRDSLVRINRGLPLDAIEEAIAKFIAEKHYLYGLSAEWYYCKIFCKRRGTVFNCSVGGL